MITINDVTPYAITRDYMNQKRVMLSEIPLDRSWTAINVKAAITTLDEFIDLIMILNTIQSIHGDTYPVYLYLWYVPASYIKIYEGDRYSNDCKMISELLDTVNLDCIYVAHASELFLNTSRNKNIINVSVEDIIIANKDLFEDIECLVSLNQEVEQSVSNIAIRLGLSMVGIHSRCSQISGRISDLGVSFGENKIRNNNLLLIGDICYSGEDYARVAAYLSRHGSLKSISMYATHGFFSKGITKLNPIFKDIYTTNSIYHQEDEILAKVTEIGL